MAWTAPTSVATGDVLTASRYNAEVVANTGFLFKPPVCRISQSVGQVINDATNTTITFGAEQFDTDGMHDLVTNNSRITINTAGVYLVVGSVNYTAGVSDDAAVNILKNGSGGNGAFVSFGPANTTAGMTTTTVLNLIATDYLQLQAYQNNSANTSRTTDTTATYLSALWIGNTA